MPMTCPTCQRAVPPRNIYCNNRCRMQHMRRTGNYPSTPGGAAYAAEMRQAHQRANPPPETPPCTSCGKAPQLPGLVDSTGPLRGLCGTCAAGRGVGARPAAAAGAVLCLVLGGCEPEGAAIHHLGELLASGTLLLWLLITTAALLHRLWADRPAAPDDIDEERALRPFLPGHGDPQALTRRCGCALRCATCQEPLFFDATLPSPLWCGTCDTPPPEVIARLRAVLRKYDLEERP